MFKFIRIRLRNSVYKWKMGLKPGKWTDGGVGLMLKKIYAKISSTGVRCEISKGVLCEKIKRLAEGRRRPSIYARDIKII